MGYKEALACLIEENERQVKHPELWNDNAWKNKYYLLQNKVYDGLEVLDKLQVLEGWITPEQALNQLSSVLTKDSSKES